MRFDVVGASLCFQGVRCWSPSFPPRFKRGGTRYPARRLNERQASAASKLA
jgi:hypothetical protein